MFSLIAVLHGDMEADCTTILLSSMQSLYNLCNQHSLEHFQRLDQREYKYIGSVVLL